MTVKIKYYNEEVKERFINTLESHIVQKFSEYPLKKAMRTEKFYDKDLYDMTEEQIGEVLKDLSCSTVDAAYNNLLKIEEYIDWSIEEGYRKSNLNPITTLQNKREWSKQFVSSYRSYLLTREQILDKMKQLINDVDKAVLLSLFEGIEGKGFSEILNLRKKDIVKEGNQYRLNLKDDGQEEPRTIIVSELLANLLVKADSQEYYINKNGMTTSERYNTSKIEESVFIFNKTTRGKQGGRPDGFYVRRKFKEFKDIFAMEHLVTKHVKDSGICHMANELQVDEILSKDGMKEIAEHYNTSYTTAGTERYRNLTKVKQVIDTKQFEELYGYKMKF